MEEAIVRLIKSVFDYTVLPGGRKRDKEINTVIVDSIAKKAELALSPWARQELIEYLGKL